MFDVGDRSRARLVCLTVLAAAVVTVVPTACARTVAPPASTPTPAAQADVVTSTSGTDRNPALATNAAAVEGTTSKPDHALSVATSGLTPSASVMGELPRPESTIVGQAGGVSQAMAVDGSLVFLGQGPRVVVLDASDPGHIVEVGRSALLPGIVTAIDVEGRTAVAGAGMDIVVLDVADPAAPTVTSTIDGLEHPVDSVVVADPDGDAGHGGHAFVASDTDDGDSELMIIEGLRSGAYVAATAEIPGSESELIIDGASLHALAYGESFTRSSAIFSTFDVSVPSEPILSASTSSLDGSSALAVGNGLLLSAEKDRIAVYELRDSSEPRFVGSMPVESAWGPVRILDDRAAVVAGGALRVVDLSDPSKPRQLGFATARLSPHAFEVEGQRAYLLESSGTHGRSAPSLLAFDLAGGDEPVELGSLRLPSSHNAITVSGDFAYVAADGLRIYDITDPAEPRLAAALGLNWIAHDVAVDGRYAYLLSDGLYVVDVADPFQPRTLSTVSEFRPVPHGISGINATDGGFVVAEGERAVVTDSYQLYDVDVSDPHRPLIVSELPPAFAYPGPGQDLAHAGGVDFADGLILVSHGSDAGRILSVVDLDAHGGPRAAASLEGPDGGAHSVAVQDDVAFVGLNGAGLWTIDVSAPQRPTPLGVLAGGGPRSTDGISVEGDRVFLTLMPFYPSGPAHREAGVREVDASDLAAPVDLGVHRTLGHPMDVAARDGLLYVADGPAGLVILDVRSDR